MNLPPSISVGSVSGGLEAGEPLGCGEIGYTQQAHHGDCGMLDAYVGGTCRSANQLDQREPLPCVTKPIR